MAKRERIDTGTEKRNVQRDQRGRFVRSDHLWALSQRRPPDCEGPLEGTERQEKRDKGDRKNE